MKKIRIYTIISFIIFFVSIIFLILSFSIDFNTHFINAICLSFGMSFMSIILTPIYNKMHNQIIWLNERVKLGNSISYRVKLAGEKSFNEMPIGIILYSSDYRIEWANKFAKEIFSSDLVERKISNINIELDAKIHTMTEFYIDVYGREYDVNVLKDDNIIFFRDRNDLKRLEKKYIDRTLACGILNLDNFDEALSDVDAQDKAVLIGEMIGIISSWADSYDIYVRGYSDKQFLILMDRIQMDTIINDEFKIINLINDYCEKENLKITVSIGMTSRDINIVEAMDEANEMLELALNRGGNQAVIKIDDDIKYYGGKVKGVDTRVPVYVRVKTEDLCDLIEGSKEVLIMAHTNADADALGGCIAALKIVKSLDKVGHIVFSEDLCDSTCKEVFNEIKSEHVQMLDYFVSPQEALRIIDNDVLLIIVDVQYQKMVIDEKVYKKAKKIAIIDHHRSNDSAINNYAYLYNKTTSSSSVELIVEMFDYLENEVHVNSFEATLMLLGIVVDTSNLMYRTSYQTFSVLSKLQMYGAEMPKVQRYLREEFDLYVKKINILNNVEMVNNKFGIAICDEDIISRDFLAKVADNLIHVESIKAGFCIGRIGKNQIGVSARSLDEFNVQMIMERLGGGGHFNNAATQVFNSSILEVKEKLIEILKDVDKMGEKHMKVILIKDVKGKGKVNDVIDIPNGHANYLIKSKLAILASPDNLNELERKNELDKQQALEHLEKMREVKAFIEANPITIGAKVGKEGKLFGTISTKQIVDEVKTEFDISLDKRKILYDKEIDHLGSYIIPIQLHREVVAKINLNVVEKK